MGSLMTDTLGQFAGGNQLVYMIPVAMFIIIFMVPIVAILTDHQRKMAKMLRESQPSALAEIEALRLEVAELRQLIAQQTFSLVDVRSQVKILPPPKP
jgi:hypothetical protein